VDVFILDSVTAQTKGKEKVGEGSSKSEKVPEISQEVFILSSNPQEEELISGQPNITLSENPIEEPKFSASSEESVHFRQDNMSGIFGGSRWRGKRTWRWRGRKTRMTRKTRKAKGYMNINY
jgi:hypothetical protein